MSDFQVKALIDVACPVLEVYNSSSWFSFRQAYYAYKTRGGKSKLKDLISANVLRLIAIQDAGLLDKSEAEIIGGVNFFFAPKSMIASLMRFEAIPRMPSLSLDSLIRLLSDFDFEEQLCASHLPPDPEL